MGHRSWLGNQLVGDLIGTKLRSIVWPNPGNVTTS